MSEERIVSYSTTSDMTAGKTDWEQVDAMTDEQIAEAIAADPDAPSLWTDEDWAKAEIVSPGGGDAVKVIVDREVVDWFREQGHPYQARINAVLRAYVKARRAGRV